MIIKEIHIDSFGIFNNLSLTGLNKGLHIIIGDNETGKSTLLAFLRYTLFGYPDARSKINPYLPPSTGKRSGRIKAVLTSGEEVIFERTEGSKGGKILLTVNETTSQQINQWQELLGNASAELYNNVYTFSLDELVSLESLSTSGVEDKIFSVGLGLGDLSFNDIEHTIQDQLNQLYNARSGKSEISAILKKINEKNAQLQQIKQNLPLYQQLILQIKQIENTIGRLQEEVIALTSKHESFKTYNNCYESYAVYLRTSEELKTLPELQAYPTNGLEQLDRLEAKAEEYQAKIEEIQSGSSSEIGLDKLTDKIASTIFNARLVKKYETVEYLRRNIEKFKQSLADQKNDEARIQQLNHAITQSLNKISAQWNEKNITDFTDLIQHRNEIEKFRSGFENLNERKREIELQRRMSDTKIKSINSETVIIAISLFFIILSIPAFMESYYSWGGASLTVAFLLFILRKYFLPQSMPDTIREQSRLLDEQEQALKQHYENYLLRQLRLPTSLAPASVMDIFQQIEHLKEEINHRDRLLTLIQQQRAPFIAAFEKEVHAVAGTMQKKTDHMPIALQAEQLIAEFDLQVSRSQEKQRLQERYQHKQKELTGVQDKLEATLHEIAQLLQSIGAVDANDFRSKYETNQRTSALIAEQSKAEQTIETIAGIGRKKEIVSCLSQSSKEEIAAKILELNYQIERKRVELESLNLQLGEKRNEIRRLEGESELAEIVTEIETEKQRLNLAYKEWLANKLALNVLADVKADFEKERQPEVIKNANTYFNVITASRYPRIQVSLNEKQVTVFDERGTAKNIEQLSRGTREQLLICLRLGFIEEYETRAESLPIIVDEILVNFDPQRALKCAKIFENFARERQVLLFTCRPDTKELFKSARIHANIGIQPGK